MEDFWHQNYALLDLLFSTNLSVPEIAQELQVKECDIHKKRRELGLTWVKRKDRKMSRGQDALTQMMKKLLPGVEIINEYHIGERLMLDIYCPKYKLAAEYHGRQHFEHVVRFHETIEDFERAQQRDLRKEELCKELGITLVVFRYNDSLTEDLVFDRLLNAINSSCEEKVEVRPKVKKSKLQTRSNLSTKNNPYYEAAKERRKEYEKMMRRKIKEERKQK